MVEMRSVDTPLAVNLKHALRAWAQPRSLRQIDNGSSFGRVGLLARCT